MFESPKNGKIDSEFENGGKGPKYMADPVDSFGGRDSWVECGYLPIQGNSLGPWPWSFYFLGPLEPNVLTY